MTLVDFDSKYQNEVKLSRSRICLHRTFMSIHLLIDFVECECECDIFHNI